jgi:hypothetical protein
MITGYKSESNHYLYGTVNGDDSWIHHYLSEMTNQSNTATPLPPAIKKFQTQLMLENECSLFFETTGALFTRSR